MIHFLHDFLRSVWAEPRAPLAPARVWRDWALVAAVVAVGLLEGALRQDLTSRAVPLIVAAALVPALLWRRTWPLGAVAIAFGTTCALELVRLGTGSGSVDVGTMMFMLVLPYSLFRWGSGREAVIGALIMFTSTALGLIDEYKGAGDAIGGFAILSSAMAIGAAFRYQARARMRELDQVKLHEREQLARDLHDTVAHHVSAIAIRAQAGLATLAANPAAAGDALRLIEAEASRTLDEMRGMVKFLRRDEPAELAPSPRIADLEQLAGNANAGPQVTVELNGDLGDVGQTVSTAIYRLAQESVTNARRHARLATRIEVGVTADDTSVRLRVSDDGERAPARAATSQGYGLLGMIERANQLGGSCEAGPDSERGWTVTAVLPRHGSR